MSAEQSILDQLDRLASQPQLEPIQKPKKRKRRKPRDQVDEF